jgi:hypothetical protein
VVRHAVGYLRYDTEYELTVLNELYGHLRGLTNFFQPQVKLVTKTRVGAKVTKVYDQPTTPYQRLLEDPLVTGVVKKSLRAQYKTLNPAQLRRDVSRCQQQLLDFSQKKNRGPEGGEANTPHAGKTT